MGRLYFIIKRQKTIIFTDAEETDSVYKLKRIVEGIVKAAPEDQQLYKKGNKDELLEDSKTLEDCGFTIKNAGPEDPAIVGLDLRLDDGSFERLQAMHFSAPVDC